MATSTPVEPPPDSAPSPLSALEVQDPLKGNTETLYKVPLQRLNCSFGVVALEEQETLQKVIKRTCRKNGTDAVMLFAIRQAS